MNFRQRLLRFAIGVTLGTGLAYFFFGNRDWQCSYFPNQRVLVELGKKTWSFAPEADAQWADLGQKDSLMVTHVLSAGDVDFARSRTQTRHTAQTDTYILTAEWEGHALEVEVENHADSLYFIRFQ